MIAVMAKTPYDNVFRTLLNKSSSPIIPVANKIFLGLRTGVGALSRGAGVSRSARPVAVLKAPIPPLPNRSEMGRIPDGFSELTTTPVVGFAARKTHYKQPCDLPVTSSNFHNTTSRAEQSRADVPWPSRSFPVAWRRGSNPPSLALYPIFLFQKSLSGFRGIQDTL